MRLYHWRWTRVGLWTILLGSLVACTPDPSPEQEMIVGRWDLREATRNGKPTTSLDELYFEFYADGTIRTNFSGATESAQYRLEENRIIQRESSLDTEYEIESINDSLMVMTTALERNDINYKFRFILGRTVQEE